MGNNGITIYVAAPWTHKEAAKAARDQLEAAGFIVDSCWFDLHGDVEETSPDRAAQLAIQAIDDVNGVLNADVLLLLNLSKSEGKAVETGLALAWRRPIVIVGERSNIFHWLPIPLVPDVQAAIDLIKEWDRSRTTPSLVISE